MLNHFLPSLSTIRWLLLNYHILRDVKLLYYGRICRILKWCGSCLWGISTESKRRWVNILNLRAWSGRACHVPWMYPVLVSLLLTHTRSHDPSPGCSGFGGPSGTTLSLESEVLRLCRREKQRLGSRAWEGRSGELEEERKIGGKAFTGGSQGHSQELRSQERCSGGGIDKSQSTWSASTTRLKCGFASWWRVWRHGDLTLGMSASLWLHLWVIWDPGTAEINSK